MHLFPKHLHLCVSQFKPAHNLNKPIPVTLPINSIQLPQSIELLQTLQMLIQLIVEHLLTQLIIPITFPNPLLVLIIIHMLNNFVAPTLIPIIQLVNCLLNSLLHIPVLLVYFKLVDHLKQSYIWIVVR
jgi:hypothetical protein